MLKIPKGQIHWESHKDIEGNITHIVTSDESKTKWYLHSVDSEGRLTKVSSGKSPTVLRK